MSSPEAGSKAKKTAKAAAPKAGKPAKAAAKSAAGKAKAVKPPASGTRLQADGLSRADKAHFVKAMWEGLDTKGGKKSSGSAAKGKAAKAGTQPEAPKVEILRRISAPERSTARQTPESAQALALATLLEQKFGSGELDVLTPEALQALMGVLCKIYGANQEEGNKFPILSGRAAVTGTDVMIACGGLLKAVDLQVFELGMWQSWSGN